MKTSSRMLASVGATALIAAEINLGRHRVRDGITYDSFRTHDANGNAMGKPLGQRFQMEGYKTRDGKMTGVRTYDSTGAFYIGELERLDQTMHPPLASVSWGRDIDLRTDVTIADEISSFTLSTFGAAGGLGTGNSVGNGKSWSGKAATQISGVSVDISKIPHNLHIWAQELAYTIPELESAARAGRPIDSQLYEALQLKYQMDIDEQVYYGDTGYGDSGLVNLTGVPNTALPAGSTGFTTWVNKTPAEILADVNQAVTTVWNTSAYAVMPGSLLIPPTQFGYISTTNVSAAGSVSILRYLLENNITIEAAKNGKGQELKILPVKWAIGAGAGGTILVENGHDRMVVYTKAKERVRFPMTGLARTPVQYDGLYHKTTYYGRLGVVENPYPETLGYFDGL